MEELENLIRQNIILDSRYRSTTGYEMVNCRLCNDYQPRGGFKFEPHAITYNCFNCSTHLKISSTSKSNTKFKDLLLAFGIDEDFFKKCFFDLTFFKKSDSKEEPNQKTSLPIKSIDLPSDSYLIATDDSEWCGIARDYLSSRMIDYNIHKFYVTENKHYIGRVIIPNYFRGKIIFWQARALDDKLITPRYKNCVVSEKDNIFFNMDEIYRYTNDTLYVSEGPIDALSIGKNCIGLNGSTLTEFKIEELKKLNRKIVFIIDKNLNGAKLAKIVINNGWGIICMPPNITDANDGLLKLGRLWLASYLVKSAVIGFQAEVIIKLNCISKT